MKNKIQITHKQALQFNRMLKALKKIAKDYQTPQQLLKSSDKQFGLDYEEALGMAYENIQGEAAFYSKGVKEIKFEPEVLTVNPGKVAG